MTQHTDKNDVALTALNRLFARTLKQLSAAGHNDQACQLAAEGWSILRHESPKEAEKLNGLLHYLTAPGKDTATVDVSISASAVKQ